METITFDTLKISKCSLVPTRRVGMQIQRAALRGRGPARGNDKDQGGLIMTMTERLLEVGCTLPQPALTELLDFAEFLRQRAVPARIIQPGTLAELCGGLEDSLTFADSPLSLQEKVRHEWD